MAKKPKHVLEQQTQSSRGQTAPATEESGLPINSRLSLYELILLIILLYSAETWSIIELNRRSFYIPRVVEKTTKSNIKKRTTAMEI